MIQGEKEIFRLRGELREREELRERWEFEDWLRVGEKWPFLPFCDEVGEVSKNLRAIILSFLGVWACMRSSLNIITFAPFFFFYNGYRYK